MTDDAAPPPLDNDMPGPQGAAAPPADDRPLLRRDHGKHAAGVAGGLADYLGVDPLVIRIAFVVLTPFGIGIPLYLVGWVAMPSPSMPQTYVERWFGRAPNPAALVAVAAAVILLFALTAAPGGDGMGWGLALLFGGWLLFRADTRASVAGAPAQRFVGPPTPAAAGTWHGVGGTAPVSQWRPPEPRPRSILGRLTIGVALAATGIAALLERAGAVALDPAQYLALAIIILGVGLVVGAWAGRAYGLIPLALLLVPFMVVLSIDNVPWQYGVGEVSVAPASVEDIPPSYGVGLGQVDVDLTRIDWAGKTAKVVVTVGIGETIVRVPDDVTVSADVEVKAGDIDLFGERFAGSPFDGPVRDVAEGAGGGGRLELVVDQALGEVTVEHVDVQPNEEF